MIRVIRGIGRTAYLNKQEERHGKALLDAYKRNHILTNKKQGENGIGHDSRNSKRRDAS